jgi:hypothetical protein
MYVGDNYVNDDTAKQVEGEDFPFLTASHPLTFKYILETGFKNNIICIIYSIIIYNL